MATGAMTKEQALLATIGDRYRSHKIVRAARITGVFGDTLSLEWGGSPAQAGADIKVDGEKMFARYTPVPGDYFVIYANDYQAISLRKEFEEGYRLMPAGAPGLASSEALAAKGATGERVSLGNIEDQILAESYFTLGEAVRALHASGCSKSVGAAHRSLELVTVCALVLDNGFVVTGESACADPKNFDAQKGRTFAREVAIKKAWGFLGYGLRDKLHKEGR